MKVFVMGDSISLQYGPYLESALDGFMEYDRLSGEEKALKNLDVPNGGNAGDSQRLLSIVQALAASGGIDADWLLLNCGLHDIKRDPEDGSIQVSVKQYEENLKEIIRLARAMKPQPIWIQTTPCDEAVHNKAGMGFHRFPADCIAFNGVARGLMRDSKVPIIDLYNFTLNLGPDLYCDHVHFTESVRRQQGAFLAGWLLAHCGL